jgi:hypothetical protein
VCLASRAALRRGPVSLSGVGLGVACNLDPTVPALPSSPISRRLADRLSWLRRSVLGHPEGRRDPCSSEVVAPDELVADAAEWTVRLVRQRMHSCSGGDTSFLGDGTAVEGCRYDARLSLGWRLKRVVSSIVSCCR